MGLLEGYFVPLYNFFLTPENFDQKVQSLLRFQPDYLPLEVGGVQMGRLIKKTIT